MGVVLPDDEPLPAGLEALEDDAEVRVGRVGRDAEDVVAAADTLFVWEFREPVLARSWQRAERLSWVHTASAGVDAVVFPDLVDSDVVVTNTRGVLDDAIAEFVLGAMLLFAKDLHTTLALQREHRWRHRESERLAGKHVLVVGAGSIGRSIARLCRAAGTTVDGLARSARTDDPDFARVGAADELHELLARADFVVISAPLTEATRGMIGARELELMQRSSRLINVGRGPIVDEEALLEALRAGEIAGAALDVFAEEPLPADHPLWDEPGVVVSPHQSGDFVGWREAFTDVFVENFRRWRSGQPLENVVDKAAAVGEANSA